MVSGHIYQPLRDLHAMDNTDAARCLEIKAGGKLKRNRSCGARGTPRRRLCELPRETGKRSCVRLADVWLVTVIGT